MPNSQLNAYFKKNKRKKRGHIGANHLTTDRGLGWEIIVHVHSVNLYYLICDILIIELFIYFSLMPYMPPPTSCNPVPHIYFLTWNNGEWNGGAGCTPLSGSEDGKQPSNDISFSAWCFYLLMWLCVEIEDGTRRTISFGLRLSLGSRGRRSHPLLSSSLLTSEQGDDDPRTLPPRLSWFFSLRKKYSSPFSPVHQEIHHPVPVYSYHISLHILSISP